MRTLACWRHLFVVVTILAVPAQGVAAEEKRKEDRTICDREWPGHNLVVEYGKRKAAGKAARPHYESEHELAPYELAGERFVFGEKDTVYEVMGRFKTRDEAWAALGGEMRERFAGYLLGGDPFVTRLGGYLPWDIKACKIDRRNPVVDPADWIVEEDGVLLVGSQSRCEKGQKNLVKKVTVVGCDGLTNLFTDSVTTSCKADVIDTCVYPLGPRVFAILHRYTRVIDESTAETARLFRVVDVDRKRRIFSAEDKKTNDEFMPANITRFNDADGDGRPEVLHGSCNRKGDCEVVKILKWDGKTYSPRPLQEFPKASLE
jgi:hypothetical protein